MANNTRLPGPSDPEEFPQVEPTELHPTNNIRFVMWEVAKLTERVDNLSTSVEKMAAALEKNADQHATSASQTAERNLTTLKESLATNYADVKERLTDFKASVDDIKDDVKEAKSDLVEIGKKVAFVKGAMWVFGGLFAIAIVILGVIARAYIK